MTPCGVSAEFLVDIPLTDTYVSVRSFQCLENLEIP